MDISKIPVGRNPPIDVNAVIEIPLGGVPVKYELDKESGAMFVDRFLHTAMFYPGNYGFIPHTLSEDGDPCDILVISNVPVVPGAVIRCRPVGALLMEDEAGMDEKVVWTASEHDHRAHPELTKGSQVEGRIIVVHMHKRGDRKPTKLYLFTTLALPAAEIVELYGRRWFIEICQSQPIKLSWCPLRLLATTIIYLRGLVKREDIVDINLLPRDDDFFNQTLSDGLAVFEREAV